MSHNYRKFKFILFTPEIAKYIQIEDLLIMMMDLKVVLIGLVL